MTKKISRDEYKVAWICPLEVEQIAAMAMLDEEHEALPQSAADHNVYSLGSINSHNVVIAGLHLPGNCPAATVVAQMRMTFPNLRFGLLVGIGGGVPVQTDDGMIRLGHVVVSKPAGEHSGAVQYDHGKARDGQFQRTGALAPPPAVLLNAAQALAVRRARMANDPVQSNVTRIDTSLRNLRRFRFPGVSNDHLYPPQYRHPQLGISCDQGGCDPSQRIHRAEDDDDTFVVVHRGTIASGELVVKTAELRDGLAQQYGLLCFEMEAAGALADFPCMVIRGISDYCDSHKNDQWHGYAAAVAAAYARQLFFHMPIDEVQQNDADARFTLAFKLLDVTGVNPFVARNNELRHMHEVLEWNGERRIAVLHGLGGMGKTQLTIAYAKRHRNDYSAIIWLNARDETSLKQSFARAAQRILSEHPDLAYIKNAKTNQDLDETVEAVKRWLDEPKNNHWLVIYDNYDDVRLDRRGSTLPSVRCVAVESGTVSNKTSETEAAKSKAYDIRPYFPETEHGAIVITTRSSTVGLGKLIQLRKLGDISDSLAILASTSNRGDLSQDPDARTLAQRLDGLPLALSTAGAYLKEVTTTCAEYLELYNASWLQLQEETPQLLHYDQAFYSTWGISFRHIQQQSQGAAMLLQLWAYFDNEDLWYELLQGGGSDSPAWLRDVTKDKFNFNRAMRVLSQHGLVGVDTPTKEIGGGSQGYSVHGCVHEWMIHVLNNGVDEQLAQTAMRCVASQVPSVEQKEYWVVQRRLLQHADRCVTRSGMGAAEKEEVWVFHKLGNLYYNQGRLKEAEAMYKRALQGKEKALGPDHTSTLDTVNNLGNLYLDQGQFKEAEAMYKQALQGYEKALGPEHTSTLDTVNNLGALYKDQGRLKEAKAMYKQALQGYKKALGPDHMSTLNTVNNLGNLYFDQGRLKEAEAMYKRALQGYEKALGPEHTSTLDTVNNLGALYKDQGRLKEAEAMYKRALQGKEKALGPDHMSTLNTVNNLGNLYLDQGRLKEAEAMYEQALQGYEKALGPEHTSTLDTVNNLGNLYLDQGRLKEAEAMYKRALQGYEKALGPDAIRTYIPALNTLEDLGSLFTKLSENSKAISFYQRAQNGFLSLITALHTRGGYFA
ncbi:NB-ARC and TPR domain protein [Colletotrichum incanum]|nr:NB-ARC and TPR domain protein [Colletotrichum incanum]